jgi:hypothetical protein
MIDEAEHIESIDANASHAAVMSACGTYRYRLQRRWKKDIAALCYVMLNPSTADDRTDDATIRKCVGFADRFGFGAIDVVNLFAYCATKPADLKAAGYLVGPHNDGWIDVAVRTARQTGGMVVCAWGVNARGLARPREVLALIAEAGMQPMVIDRCSDGTPAHPLTLPYSCTLSPL